MPLDRGKLTALQSLLRDCTVHLQSAAGGRGSGFFLDESHVLTCAHVVKSADAEVDVLPHRRDTSLKGRVVKYLPGDDVDLALIEVEPDEGEQQPAVVLHRALHDNVSYYAVGYPKDGLLGQVRQEGITYVGHTGQEQGGENSLLVLEAGQGSVTPGLSGGPVLNPETGAVVALVQYTLNADMDAGGGAIPIERAMTQLPFVRRCADDPPTATHLWRSTLDEEGWQALGKTWGWERSIDVYLRGDRTEWRVLLDADDADPQIVTVRDLSCRASEALFLWAERGSARKAEQVLLLGDLLTEALFPTVVMERIVRERLADDLLIRLHIDKPLFDVPWEFVAIEKKHLAAERGVGIVRIGNHADPDQTSTTPSAAASVLAVVMQPKDWQPEMPKLLNKAWPDQEETLRRVRKAVPAAWLRSKVLPNPTPTTLQSALEAGRHDVLHYVGFGKMHGGAPSLALSDGEGDAKWQATDEIFSWIADSGARLVIVELLLPPSGNEFEPIPAFTFQQALSHGVNAVIFTRLPVHLLQAHRFNESLYAALVDGKPIEEAVQNARSTLRTDGVLSDAAGFGWFTLLTGPKSGMKIASGGAQQRKVKQDGLLESGQFADRAARHTPAAVDRFGS